MMSCKDCGSSYMTINKHENKHIWRCTDLPHMFFYDLKTMEEHCKVRQVRGLEYVK